MAKDNPRHHRAVLTFEQHPGMRAEVWSYKCGVTREFHFALIGPDGYTLGQAKFRTLNATRSEDRAAQRAAEDWAARRAANKAKR